MALRFFVSFNTKKIQERQPASPDLLDMLFEFYNAFVVIPLRCHSVCRVESFIIERRFAPVYPDRAAGQK